jgi:hypothetical protein
MKTYHLRKWFLNPASLFYKQGSDGLEIKLHFEKPVKLPCAVSVMKDSG